MLELAEVAVVLLEQLIFKPLKHGFVAQFLARMFIDLSKLLFKLLILPFSDLAQVEVGVPLFVVANQVAVACEVLKTHLALENLDGQPLWLSQHSLVRL
jgi:hypothetical protein